MAIEVGTAYVSILPSTKGLGKSIASDLRQLDPLATAAGRRMGSALSAGVSSTAGGAQKTVEELRDAVVAASRTAADAAAKNGQKQQDAQRKVEIAQLKLNETLARYGAESSQAASAQDRLIMAQRKLESATKAAADEQAALRARVGDAAEALRNAQTAAESSAQGTENAFSGIGARIKAALTGDFSAAFAGIRNGASDAADEVAEEFTASGEESSDGFFQKFGGKIAGYVAGIGVGAAVLDGFGNALDAGRLNDKMAAQLGLTPPEAERVGQISGSLFANAYGESLGEVNDAVGAVMSSISGMADAPAADVESMTAKVLDLATAFELDAGRAAQVAGQMITSGLAVDGVHAIDLLADSMQKVPAAVREDILDAVDEYAPFMQSLGIEGETAMGLLVNASEKGMFGIDKLGDALKEFTIRSTDMSKATGAAYEALGLDQLDMSNALLAGGDVAQSAFGDIVHGLQEMEDPASQAAAAIALFGTPLEDLGVNEIPEFLGQIDPMGDSFDSVAGAAERLGNTLNDNAATKIESFKRTAQMAFVDFLGNDVLPTAERFSNWIRDKFGPTFSTVADYVQGDVLPALTAFGGFLRDDVLPALSRFGKFLADNRTMLEGVTVAVVAGVAAFKTFMMVQAVTSAVKAFSAASSIAAAKQWLLNSAMLANPVGLIIAGIAALVAGLVWFFTQTDTGRAIVENAWAGIQAAVSVVVDWFQTSVMPVLSAIWEGIAAGATWLYENAIRPAWLGIQSAVLAVATWFQVTLLPAIRSVFDKVGAVFSWLYTNIVKPVFDLIVWYIGVWWTIASGIFQVAVALIRNYLAPIFTWLYESVIKPVFSWIGSVISLWWAGAQIVFGAVVGFFQNVVGPIFVWLYQSVIRPVFGWIGSLFSSWWAGAKIVFGAVVGFLRNTLGVTFTWFRDSIISPVFDRIRSIISSVWESGIRPVFETLTDFVQNKLPSAFEAAKNGITTAWDKIKEAARKPVEFVVNKVINDGLIDTFNKIPGVDIKRVPLPPGFRKGGYTGDVGRDDVAGVVHGREYVFTAAQTAAIGKDKLAAIAANAGRSGAAATAGEGNMGGFFEGNAANIRRHGAYFLNVPASMAPWNFAGAARMWDGAAGVRVGVGRGQAQGYASSRERGGGILGYTVGNNIDMSPSWMARLGATQRRTVAAHEMGHALGLPHNSRSSIMQPNLANMASSPTAVDIRNLQALYPGGSGRAGSAVDNPFDGIVDKLMDKFKSAFPGGGMFIDAAGGLAKSGIGQVVQWVQDIKDGLKNVASDVVDNIRGFFGGGAATATVYDGGGLLKRTDQPQLVHHRRSRPDAVLSSEQWSDISKLALADSRPTREIVIQGNVGWDPDEVVRQIETQERRARVIEGVYA